MFSHTVKYENFEHKKVEKELWFHITKLELIKMELEFEGGMINLITAMIEADATTVEGKKKIVQLMEEIVLRSYGIRPPEDADAFLKNDEIRNLFAQSLPYEAIMDELAFGPNADENMSRFIKYAFPASLVDAGAKAIADAGGDIKKALETVEAESKTQQPPSFQ